MGSFLADYNAVVSDVGARKLFHILQSLFWIHQVLLFIVIPVVLILDFPL